MPPATERLLVFARAPQSGVTKTRLIPALGADGAAALHARLIEHTLRVAQRSGLPVELHGDPVSDAFLQFCAKRFRVPLVAQADGDLGARMHAALATALQCSSGAVLIGTDCPALEVRHLRAAAEALRTGYHAVFVPAEDGGYALVGITRAERALFAGVPWGTSEVMAATRSRVVALGWRALELQTLWDVDRPEDHQRLIESGLLDGRARAVQRRQ